MTERLWNVLLVDDDDFVRVIVARQLALRGCKVAQASNGHEAWTAVQEMPPDVIICDIMMPMVDGLQFCRRLRAKGDQTPLLFLSSKGETEHILEGLCIGADDYLRKPFDFRELEVRMLSILRRSRTTPLRMEKHSINSETQSV